MLCKGTYTLATLSTVIVNTTDKAISRFPPAARGCYIDEEFKLKRLSWEEGYRYSMKNCLYSAVLGKIASNCSCVPDFYENFMTKRMKVTPCRYSL